MCWCGNFFPLGASESGGCAGAAGLRGRDRPLGPSACPLFPAGRAGPGGGAEGGASTPRGGAARARRREAGSPSPPPLPHPGLAPPRAHTRESRRHANEVPERRGARVGGRERARGGPGPCAPGARPPPAPARATAEARAPTSRPAEPARLAARAQTPFLARPSSPRLGAAHWPPPPQGPPRAVGAAGRARACARGGGGRGSRPCSRDPGSGLGTPPKREPCGHGEVAALLWVSLWVPALMCFSPFTLVHSSSLVPGPGGGADGRWFGAYYNRQPCYVHFTEVGTRSERQGHLLVNSRAGFKRRAKGPHEVPWAHFSSLPETQGSLRSSPDPAAYQQREFATCAFVFQICKKEVIYLYSEGWCKA